MSLSRWNRWKDAVCHCICYGETDLWITYPTNDISPIAPPTDELKCSILRGSAYTFTWLHFHHDERKVKDEKNKNGLQLAYPPARPPLGLESQSTSFLLSYLLSPLQVGWPSSTPTSNPEAENYHSSCRTVFFFKTTSSKIISSRVYTSLVLRWNTLF